MFNGYELCSTTRGYLLNIVWGILSTEVVNRYSLWDYLGISWYIHVGYVKYGPYFTVNKSLPHLWGQMLHRVGGGSCVRHKDPCRATVAHTSTSDWKRLDAILTDVLNPKRFGLVHSAKIHGHIPNVADIAPRDMMLPTLYLECLTCKKKDATSEHLFSWWLLQPSQI